MVSKKLHKTIGLRKIMFTCLFVAAVCVSSYIFFSRQAPTHAYHPNCTSQACREAADKAESAQRNAIEAANNAQTLEDEVNQLNAEISALEAEISANQAVVDDLSDRITTNEEKLNLQQVALAKLLEKSYREDKDGSDVIVLLAGSESIGDFAEKKSRQTSVETQVSSSTKEIKKLKEELEAQKKEVDRRIASDESNRNQIAEKRNEQEELMNKYRNDTAAYEKDAAEARAKMQSEIDRITEETRRTQTGGIVSDGRNSYPWAANCPRDNANYIVVGGYVCQCTSYAGWKAKEYWGIYISSWGHAKSWGASAASRGYTVNDTPAPHTIGYSTAGEYGHVVWVESVNSDGTINLTEYNNILSAKSGLPGDFGARNRVNPQAYRYIHFD